VSNDTLYSYFDDCDDSLELWTVSDNGDVRSGLLLTLCTEGDDDDVVVTVGVTPQVLLDLARSAGALGLASFKEATLEVLVFQDKDQGDTWTCQVRKRGSSESLVSETGPTPESARSWAIYRLRELREAIGKALATELATTDPPGTET